MKRKVSEIVKYCKVNLNSFPMKVNLDTLTLGLYDILIGMDWLEQHHVMLNCLHKSILCTDIQGNQIRIQDIPKKVSIRKISTLQEKKSIRKGRKLFAVNIQDVEPKKEQHIEDFPILVYFVNAFPEEIPGLALK